jgi:5-oxoprolinase (ATP-hydrolysing) subunit A
MLICDLNCDMGEGIGNEQEIMPFISSANIACGFHAGDTDTIRSTIELCLRYNVNIGAHPSYPDRENFGRKDLLGISLCAKDIEQIVAEQVHLVQKISHEMGTNLSHVKPHGALYNRVAYDAEAGEFLCAGIKSVNKDLSVFGLSGSVFRQTAERNGLKFTDEVFADRSYRDDGSLTPRTEANALIQTSDAAAQQVKEMVENGRVKTVTGNYIPVTAKTICIHGDGAHAAAFAKKLFHQLKRKAQ